MTKIDEMKKILFLAFLVTGTVAKAQSEYAITIDSKKPSGIIDEMLYGQLFEHIYFSANNGVRNVHSSLSSIRAFLRETVISTAGIWMMTWCCIRLHATSSH